jgi:hypothetical protein
VTKLPKAASRDRDTLGGGAKNVIGAAPDSM